MYSTLESFDGCALSTEVPQLSNNYKNKRMNYVNNSAWLMFLKISIFFLSLDSHGTLACLPSF